MAALAVGCQSGNAPSPETGDPWAAEFEAAYANARSDFLRSLLADRDITAAEYDEAVNSYVTCMNDAFPELGPDAFQAQRGPDGLVTGYSHSGPTDVVAANEETDRIEGECRETYLGDAVPLYEFRKRNPEHLEPQELIRKCLIDEGLVDESYTVENWDADRYYDGRVDGDVDPGPVPAREDATDLDATSPEVMACLSRI